ncbi:MAG: flagellar assembly protein FliX [Rickettsiales bacterium]|nr:flagellar assembly protein FliX [Rickettsiales bacterium]
MASANTVVSIYLTAATDILDAMIKITEYSSVKSTGSVRKRSTSSSVGNFSELLDSTGIEGAGAPPATSDIAPANPLSNLLSLQEVSDEAVQRRKWVARGNNLLDSLESLRQQLLVGRIPLSSLETLEHELAKQKQNVNDPYLLALMDDIELRVAVELAKLNIATARAD